MKIAMEAVNDDDHFVLARCNKEPLIYLGNEDKTDKRERRGFWFVPCKYRAARLRELIECCEAALLMIENPKSKSKKTAKRPSLQR
jgi:coenzyme F420-reducing hydrogenase alpha subunit